MGEVAKHAFCPGTVVDQGRCGNASVERDVGQRLPRSQVGSIIDDTRAPARGRQRRLSRSPGATYGAAPHRLKWPRASSRGANDLDTAGVMTGRADGRPPGKRAWPAWRLPSPGRAAAA